MLCCTMLAGKRNQFSSLAYLLIFLSLGLLFFLLSNVLRNVDKNRNIRQDQKLRRVCKAGKKYEIKSVQNLWDNEEDLHCIFHLGWEMQRVPEGPFHGEMISFGESYFLNPLIRATWMGKLVTKVDCKDDTTAYLGWNYFAGPSAPFVASVGILRNLTNTDNIYRDGKSALLFDYMPDLKSSCGGMKEASENEYPIKTFSPWRRNFWPFTQITDILRPVGKLDDGGIIYLGQMYAVNIFRSDKKSTPVCFFATVNYDEAAVPDLKPGMALPQLKQDVHYNRIHVLRSLSQFFPVNVLNEPVHTTKTVFVETHLALTNGIRFAKDFILSQFSDEKVELEKRMKPPSSLVLPSKVSVRKVNYLSSTNSIHSHQLEL